MGKATGFLEYARKENTDRDPRDRINDYEELHLPLDPQARREQGARCMNCGVPMCQSAIRLKGMVTGCPLHNLIPEWNDQIYAGHERPRPFPPAQDQQFSGVYRARLPRPL